VWRVYCGRSGLALRVIVKSDDDVSRKERARFEPAPRLLNTHPTFIRAKKKGYPEGSPFSLHLVEVAGFEPASANPLPLDLHV